MYTDQEIWGLRDVINLHEDAGGYFFSPGARRFFKSRVGETIHPVLPERTQVFFVTSEVPPHGNRAYKVRHFDSQLPARVTTVGDLGGYKTAAAAAHCEAARLAEEGPNEPR
ncbi:MAG: hypothetical protein KQJ78_23150 [Deltaproteobacteria bacterium]|nr:hypothetical protein [Deltaproteobacteria bacterium]